MSDEQPQPDSADTEQEPTEQTADQGADTFDRAYVEKLRKEAAGYRDRAQTAETRVTALQQAQAEQAIREHGLKPEAVFAVTGLDDLVDDTGTVDPVKVRDAVSEARDRLGINTKIKLGTSGAMRPQPPREGFASAFRPRER